MLHPIKSEPILENRTHGLKWIDIIIENIPIYLAEKVSSIAPLIPCYHLVSNEKLIHVYHLYSYKNEKQFTSDVDFFCSRYQPISLVDLIDGVRGGKKLKNGSFLLTFDDGYSQMYSVVAPILFKKGIPAIFFLSTDFIDNKTLFYRNKASIIVESISENENSIRCIGEKLSAFRDVPFPEVLKRILSLKYNEAKVLDEIATIIGIRFDDYLKSCQPYLSSVQVRKMIEMGFYFGAHSLDHPIYADLELEDQLKQTIESLRIIKSEFNLPYSLFAFPHNDYLVTKAYFRIIEDYTDLTFGTRDVRADLIASNLQRINFEKPLKPAKNILTRYFIKKRINWFLHKSNIARA